MPTHPPSTIHRSGTPRGAGAAEAATAALPTSRSMPNPARVDEGLTVAELLELLEEPRLEDASPPAIVARGLVLATAAQPRVAAAGRRLATVAAVTTLMILVSLAALLVVIAEKTAGAVASADLPGRAAICARKSRTWAEHVADRLEAWSERAAQWGLGPRGAWMAWREPRAGAFRLDGPRG